MDPSWTRDWPPGASEKAGEWTVQKLSGTAATGRRFEAAALTQALYACVIQPEQPASLTIAIAGPRLRITGRPVHKLSAAAVRAWSQQATRLADRHNLPDDPAGLWAELDLIGAQS